jgi:hypothetical protein
MYINYITGNILADDIERKCFGLVRKLGLQFGAIDMAVTPGQGICFFEGFGLLDRIKINCPKNPGEV